MKVRLQDKVYAFIMDKAVVLLYIGSEALEKGMNILGAHIDSPRKDMKKIRCTRKLDLPIWIRTITAA